MLGAGQSPLSHHKSYVIRSPLAGDRFKSPVVTHLARRQLFSGTYHTTWSGAYTGGPVS